MKRINYTKVVYLFLGLFLHLNLNAQSIPIKKSTVLFTQEGTANPSNYQKYKADGVFWGFMPNSNIQSDRVMNQWVKKVEKHTSNSKYFFGRGEFDWGWKWMIDYMDDPSLYWAKNLNGNDIHWGNAADAGGKYKGYTHSWMSHQGPEFLNWLKYQVDRMTLAPVTHMMFDSQTSATRTLQWLGGDFSVPSMNGFRNYLKNKYSTQELAAMGIANINNFNYRQFLLNRGFSHARFRSNASSIEGNIPLYKDFVYFQRQSLNDTMEELFDYIDTKRPGIEIGATTNVVEPRGYVFSDRLTYLAGEYGHPHDVATSPSTGPLLHYKAAEALDKSLIYFPYPDAFEALYKRNSPRQVRAWIAQAYASGSIFTIPGNVWIGGGRTWSVDSKYIADIYAFVKDHSELFDDYKAYSNVGLVYSVYASLLESGMSGSVNANKTLDYLIKENISFDLQIFGDPDKPITPASQELSKYEAIIHDNDIKYLTAEQNNFLKTNGSNVISVSASNNVLKNLSWKVDVLTNNQIKNDIISVLPRVSSEDDNAPYVLHLINRKYNPSQDKAQLHRNVTVKFSKTMFKNVIKGVKYHIPGKPSVDVQLQTDSAGDYVLDIGTFDSCWGILELINEPSVDHNIVSIPGIIEGENFVNKSDNIQVENTPNTTDGKNLGYILNGDYTDYRLNVSSEGSYSFQFYASSAGVGGTIDVIDGNTVLGSVAIPKTGEWHDYKPYGVDISLTSGLKNLKFLYKGENDFLFNLDRVVVTKDEIKLANVATTLSPADSYTFDVVYSASINREVVVSFWNNGTWVAAQVEEVTSGENKNKSVTIALPSVTTSGNGYSIKAHIRPVGTDYQSALDNDEITDINVFNQLISNGTYFIKSPFGTQRLLARGLENHSARMHDAGNFDDQKWIFTHLGDNVYSVQNKGTQRYLEVPNGDCSNGLNVATWTEAIANHQKWKVVANGSGVYGLKPMHCEDLGLDRARGVVNANAIIWNYNPNNDNQKWNIVEDNVISSREEFTSTPITSKKDERKLFLFPNPSKDVLFVSGLMSGDQISIYNIQGRKVKTLVSTNEKEEISVTDLTTGFYIVNVNGMSKMKFVKK